MRKLIGARCTGKTVQLVRISARDKLPILVYGKRQANYINEVADKLGVNIPKPLILNDLKHGFIYPYESILVDEADVILDALIYDKTHLHIDTITLPFTNGDYYIGNGRR